MPFARTVATALTALATALSAALLIAPHAEATNPEAAVSAPARGEKLLGPGEMRSAQPAEADRMPSIRLGPTASASNTPAGPFEVASEQSRPLSAHGRVFYSKDGESSDRLYSCSGTVVRSAGANIVFTAGHCVYDRETNEFHTNVVFVPAYREGESPFGQFPAHRLHAPAGWVYEGDTTYDLGVITVEGAVQRRVGGRRIAFSQSFRRIGRLALFGYPAEPGDRYDGERPIGCDSALRRVINSNGSALLVASPCDMQRGASGGGWVTPAGNLISVVSHGYCSADPRLCNQLWGPYFGTAALRLYREAGLTERMRMLFRRSPGTTTVKRRPGFRIAVDASTPVSLECRVNRGPVRPCRAAFRLPRLDPGRHALRVRATDQLGRKATIGHLFRIVEP